MASSSSYGCSELVREGGRCKDPGLNLPGSRVKNRCFFDLGVFVFCLVICGSWLTKNADRVWPGYFVLGSFDLRFGFE